MRLLLKVESAESSLLKFNLSFLNSESITGALAVSAKMRTGMTIFYVLKKNILICTATFSPNFHLCADSSCSCI